MMIQHVIDGLIQIASVRPRDSPQLDIPPTPGQKFTLEQLLKRIMSQQQNQASSTQKWQNKTLSWDGLRMGPSPHAAKASLT